MMVPLRVRSSFSLLRGTSSPADLCRAARAYGYRSLALTDIDNLYGLWEFLAACRQEKIKPIIGAEIGKDAFGAPLVCLVTGGNGYKNLCRLISRRKMSQETLSAEEILAEGLFLLTSDVRLLENLYESGLNVAADLGCRPSQQGSLLRKEARRLGVPAVCTPDSDMSSRQETDLHLLLRAIERKSMLAEGASERDVQVNSLEPPEVYGSRFAIWPEVVAATEEIAERCRFCGPGSEVIMPPWQTASGGDAHRVLREHSYSGARYRYGGDLTEVVVDRLEHELQIIRRMNYSSYFLVVRDIVHPLQPDGSRRRRRICGRGSGAASLVAYCLGITNVCPIKHNLYFERFLNPGRNDPPDIDIDFAWDERDAVLDEVLAQFGEHIAMVSSHVYFKPRMAIRETARAYGLPGYEISRMTKRLPWFRQREDESLQERIEALPVLRDQDFSEPWPQIIALAGRLVGLPRYISVHPGGVIITPEPICDYVPVERAPKGVPVIQWDKDGAEEAGLVKIDLLGNRSLAVIRDSIAAVRGNGVDFSERTWEPEDDVTTKAAVSRGQTMGCFYIESPAMRLLQKKANSGEFEQLVLQSSIIRPAANEFVREYVRRLHGGTWTPLHPELESVLDETFGLMVYQEDVSRVAVALAGFSHSDGDGLRKIMSKKDRERKLPDYLQAFAEGCAEKGLTPEDIEKIWAMMMSFNGYSFCKPHSASYAKVSYQAAYMKAHYPAEFMAAVISNRGGFYSTFAYVSEAKRMGVVIDPPDVQLSRRCWTGKKGRIRVGLCGVAELSEETSTKIVTMRAQEPYRDFSDFLSRVKPAVQEVRSLVHAGALDSINSAGNRASLLWGISCREQKGRGRATVPLFYPEPAPTPVFPPQERINRLRNEYRALGFLCGTHPISLIKKDGLGKIVSALEVEKHVGKTIRFVGWLLTGKLVSTKTGEVMEFLTFEDHTGLLETTFFPVVYRKYAHILASGTPYLLQGYVESDYGAVTMTVDSVKSLGRKRCG